MTTGCQQLVGYHPPYFWQANGVLSLYPVAAAGALDGLATAQIGLAPGAGSFDGFRKAYTGLLIDTLDITQRKDGTSGTTDVEFYRLRAGIWTSLGVVSLAFGAGGGASASLVPATVPLRTLVQADVVVACMVTVQANGEDLTAAASYT